MSDSTRSNRYWPLALAGLICVAGCGYPRVSSDAVELTQVIDRVCNLRAEAQIEPARRLVSDRRAEGRLSEKEEKMLEKILRTAEQGHWETASNRCRDLLRAQTTPNRL